MLIEPSLAKQDIGQMQKDIRKYKESDMFTEQDRTNWDTFLSEFSSIYGSILTEQPNWVLESFQAVNVRYRDVMPSYTVSDKKKNKLEQHSHITRLLKVLNI